MKKLLALVLALVMVMGLSVVSTSAAYADAAKIEHSEAVDVLSSLDVVGGKENNNFDPTGNVKRSEMAKMITISVLGDVDVSAFTGTATDLTDIDGHWAEGYIKYCYSQGIIGGRGNGKFDPDANVTAAEAAKMCLVALGYNADVQGYIGDQWAINVTRDAQLKDLYEELSGLSSSKVLTRDETAQMIYNTLDAVRIEATKGVDSNGVITTTYRDATNAATDTLLEKTFGMQKYEGIMDGVTYNTTTKRYRYTFNVGANVTSPAAGGTTDTGAVYSETDYSEYFGQKVEMLWKTDKKTGDQIAYGIVKDCNTVTATEGELTIGTGTAATDKKVKLADVEYSLSAAENVVPVFKLDNGADAVAALSLSAGTLDKASTLTLVDYNKDGKYDYAIAIPATVAKVSYVGSKSITAGATYKFEDDDIQSGLAKDDFVKIIAAKNAAKGAAIVTKLDTVEGTVTAMAGNKVMIDGKWYDQAPTLIAGGDAAAVNNTDRLYVVGDYYYYVKKIDGTTVDDVLFIMDAGTYTTGLNTGAEAKVMFAKDGAVSKIVVSKVNADGAGMVAVTTVGAAAAYNTAANIVKGGMYTFKLKDGAYELTRLTNNVIGASTTFATGAAAYDDNGLNGTDPSLGGKAIADDAVIMVYTTNGGGKSAYVTGAALKTWVSGGYGITLVQTVSKKVNGVDTVILGSMLDTNALPGKSGSTHYGYLTDDSALIKDGDDYFMLVTMWTDEGQLTQVKAESYDNTGTDTGITNTPALAGNNAFLKGSFVSYERLSNGNVGHVTAIETRAGGVGATYALTGSYTNKDGEQVLTLESDAYTGGGTAATTTRVDKKDTVVLYVNTADIAGVASGELALATQTAVSGYYVKNVVAKDNAGTADVIFVDISNNLYSNAGLSAFSASGTVTAFNATTGVLTINANTAAGTVATDAATAFGALAAQLNDTNADTNSDSGESVTIVSANGDTVTYTIA